MRVQERMSTCICVCTYEYVCTNKYENIPEISYFILVKSE